MNLIDGGEKVTERQIVELEHSLSVLLPQGYKDFLLEHNGGIPEKDTSFRFMERDSQTGEPFDMESDIQNFSKLEELPFFYQNLIEEEVIPPKYLSIACDSCGNEILLCADESNNYGKIYFGNHEEFDPETNYYNLSVIANSFLEFMAKLSVC